MAGPPRVEASGNVDLATVAGIAATGVDVISIGGLTHSVAALDLGLDIELRPGGDQHRADRNSEQGAGQATP